MAIAISTGAYLCFQDIDDEMLPQRILKQYALARRHKDAVRNLFSIFLQTLTTYFHFRSLNTR